MKVGLISAALAFLVIPSLASAACQESIAMENGWLFKRIDSKQAALVNPQGTTYMNILLTDIQDPQKDVIGVLTQSSDRPKAATWAACFLQRSSRSMQTIESDSIDTVTPSVPGCPKYLSKSMVVWSRKANSNPQLNVWEVKNVSNNILKVTYQANGTNNDSGTLNPGESVEIWQLTEEPPYVVRDFKKLTKFNESHSQQKALQCSLAIRPR